MKYSFALFSCLLCLSAFAQQNVDVPGGVMYKYADSATNEKAKSIISKEVSATPGYSLSASGMLFIGPVLWGRYKDIGPLNGIKGGNITIRGYKDETSAGKLTQSREDFKLIWDQVRSEVKAAGSFTLRKATAPELKYYWSVISFDIEEPLFILETSEHNYILNLSKKDFTLVWLDEVPR